jgi:beta-lactamase regulating signal transducer with metallopeptidase domain
MTTFLVAINAVAQLTIWLALVCGSVWLIRNTRSAVQLRVVLLRVGLIGAPVVLAVGLCEHRLPWAKALWQVAPSGQQAGVQQPASPARQQAVQPVAIGNATEPLANAEAAPGGEHELATAASPATPAPAANSDSSTTARLLAVLPWAILLAYLAGAGMMLLRLAWGLVRLQRRRRAWRTVDDPAVLKLAARVAEHVGLRRRFRVLVADDLPMPVATGIRHAAVALPAGQLAYLDTPQGRAVLAHELAHLRYRDPLWRLLGAMLRAVLWFHPLMIWLNRRSQVEAEFRCDQSALASGASRHGYAKLLVDLAELAWGDRPLGAAAIGAVGQVTQLERRLQQILSRTPVRPDGLSGGSRAAIAVLAVVLVGSLSSIALLGDQPMTAGRGQSAVATTSELVPAAQASGEADYVSIMLTENRWVQGIWLGSTADGIRVASADGEKIVPLREVVLLRTVRQQTPDDSHRRGGDWGPRLAEEQGKLRAWLASAESELAKSRSLPPDSPHRVQLIESAEKEVAAARGAVDQASRRMMPRSMPVELPANMKELLKSAEAFAAEEQWAEAIAAAERVRAEHPRHGPTLRVLALAYEKTGQMEKLDEIRRLLQPFGGGRGMAPFQGSGREGDRPRDFRRDGDNPRGEDHKRDPRPAGNEAVHRVMGQPRERYEST